MTGRARGGARLVAVALGAGLLLAGCTGGDSTPAGTSFVAGDGVVTTVPADRRKDPIQLVGSTLSGDRLDLATLRGKPVVVNIWGSWCGPCRKEADDLQAASTQLAPSGVRFLGIDVRDNTASAQAFVRNFGITYPSLAGDDAMMSAFNGAASAAAIPTTLVLDARGRIAARLSGAVTTRTLVDLVGDISAGR